MKFVNVASCLNNIKVRLYLVLEDKQYELFMLISLLFTLKQKKDPTKGKEKMKKMNEKISK